MNTCHPRTGLAGTLLLDRAQEVLLLSPLPAIGASHILSSQAHPATLWGRCFNPFYRGGTWILKLPSNLQVMLVVSGRSGLVWPYHLSCLRGSGVGSALCRCLPRQVGTLRHLSARCSPSTAVVVWGALWSSADSSERPTSKLSAKFGEEFPFHPLSFCREGSIQGFLWPTVLCVSPQKGGLAWETLKFTGHSPLKVSFENRFNCCKWPGLFCV